MPDSVSSDWLKTRCHLDVIAHVWVKVHHCDSPVSLCAGLPKTKGGTVSMWRPDTPPTKSSSGPPGLKLNYYSSTTLPMGSMGNPVEVKAEHSHEHSFASGLPHLKYDRQHTRRRLVRLFRCR